MARAPYQALPSDQPPAYPPSPHPADAASAAAPADDAADLDAARPPSSFTRRTYVALALAAILVCLATLKSAWQRPFSFDAPPLPSPELDLSPPPTTNATDDVMSFPNQTAPASGKRSVGYFVNWGIYDRKYLPQELPAERLTHVLYAFANVKPEDGSVYLTDAWADEQIHWDGDSWNDEGNNLYGCFKQLALLKRKNRHLKVLLSIGGWTYSANFANLVSTAHRQTFARSAVQILEDYGLDGLDIDWEYPKNQQEARAYTELLREVREELDRHQTRKDGSRATFDLSIAAPAGADTYSLLDISGMDRYLSFWNVMAYDFQGSWSAATGHQAQLYGPPNEPSVDQAIQWYKSRGVRPDKLVVGMPLYGRSFAQTNGGPGQPFSGVGEGTWEAGMYDYRALPRPDSVIGEDLARGAGWSYDAAKREWVSFDTPNVGATKAHYIRAQGLGGAMFWELDADLRPADSLQDHALVPIVVNELGGIDRGQTNCLVYGDSKWDNLRKGL